MRVIVLVVAAVVSLGSAHNARGRYAANSAACGMLRDPVAQQTCYQRAGVSYAVDSQEELIDQQNAREDARRAQASDQVTTQRCERVAGVMMTCQIGTPDDFDRSRAACWSALRGSWPAGYATTVCVEQARDCDQVTWCLSQATPAGTVQTVEPVQDAGH